jgi:hypothetical protein
MNYRQVLQAIDDITGSIASMFEGDPPLNQLTGKEENDGGS